jgi:hypothetical protein
MGQCLSNSDADALREPVSPPHAPPEPQLSAQMTVDELNAVVRRLHAERRNVSIVVVGGVVYTVLLQTCVSTGDVDFFYRTKTKHEDLTQLFVTADSARSSLNLGQNWLNNHIALFIQVRERLGRLVHAAGP